ncbi:HlyD family efflux transporter periplasmic adaptor subunit [Pseudobacteroides cellulosolvens]|uniref:Secretion protein HlyD family protein n=1 Tax=Pseudobacteroides cellulosolvens ATCC 35603 = DSM 2933 TaxID=398512 RepID=A0A0L6JVG5_9FIRM|nr:HlyD family efflux transporter periplasmic adaptor subunit [Pseudobacteroides cellulosolvens]KNY29427.1 hypothetical protein Bccel_4701 [Pseudobacteroides cellulosolvens ATCC 35603 = DSM 2933]
MKKVIGAILVGTFLFTAAACASDNSQSASQNQMPTAKPVKDTIDVFGQVKYKTSKSIYIDFPAVVASIDVFSGQVLKKGDSIITLDLKNAKSQIKAKENEIDLAVLELKNMKITSGLESSKARNNKAVLQKEIDRLYDEMGIKKTEIGEVNDEQLKKLQNELQSLNTQVEDNKNLIGIHSKRKENEIKKLEDELDEKKNEYDNALSLIAGKAMEPGTPVDEELVNKNRKIAELQGDYDTKKAALDNNSDSDIIISNNQIQAGTERSTSEIERKSSEISRLQGEYLAKKAELDNGTDPDIKLYQMQITKANDYMSYLIKEGYADDSPEYLEQKRIKEEAVIAIEKVKSVKSYEINKLLGAVADANKELDYLKKNLSSKDASLQLDKVKKAKQEELKLIKKSIDDAKYELEAIKKNRQKEIKQLEDQLETLKQSFSDYKVDKEKELKQISLSITNNELSIKSTMKDMDNAAANRKKELEQIVLNIAQKKVQLDNLELDLKSEIDRLKIETQEKKIELLIEDLGILKDKLKKNYINGDKVISEFDSGLVYSIECQTGDVLSSANRVATIIDSKNLHVEASVPEEFIKDVKIGAKVDIIPIANKAKTYSGKVEKIAGLAKQNNGDTSITVIIGIDNADGFIVPDYNVDVKIKK